MLGRIHNAWRRLSRGFGTDITTIAGRRAAWLHFYLFDHAFLRILWTNHAEIAPGVWRANQPSPQRLRALKARGLRSVLNLRGTSAYAFHLFERETCDALGLTLINHKIYPRRLVPPAQLSEIFAIFDQIEKPFLLHCKSGADRAGLVSALWLLDQEGCTLTQARRMLSLRFLHLKSTHTGLMDAILDAYEADTRDAPMLIREWVATRYDPDAITADFYGRKGQPVPGTKTA
ncbi:MAG: tyrosine-protein phosphatase [Pseudomonadota bacterium]